MGKGKTRERRASRIEKCEAMTDLAASKWIETPLLAVVEDALDAARTRAHTITQKDVRREHEQSGGAPNLTTARSSHRLFIHPCRQIVGLHLHHTAFKDALYIGIGHLEIA
jgi:hypothetical protein